MWQPAALALPEAPISTWNTSKEDVHYAGCLFAAFLSGLSKQMQSLSPLSAILIHYVFLSFALMGFPGCASF